MTREGWDIATLLIRPRYKRLFTHATKNTKFCRHIAAMSSPKEFLAEEVLVEKKVVSSDTVTKLSTT